MKYKEKQIEEMANCKNCVHQKMCIDKISCGVLTADKDGYLKLKCNYYQPKLPEDSVVLLREEKQEYENLVKLLIYDKPIKSRVYEFVKDTKEQARKETAEKFVKGLIDKLKDNVNADNVDFFVEVKKMANETAKQFGVEIKG